MSLRGLGDKEVSRQSTSSFLHVSKNICHPMMAETKIAVAWRITESNWSQSSSRPILCQCCSELAFAEAPKKDKGEILLVEDCRGMTSASPNTFCIAQTDYIDDSGDHRKGILYSLGRSKQCRGELSDNASSCKRWDNVAAWSHGASFWDEVPNEIQVPSRGSQSSHKITSSLCKHVRWNISCW